MSAIAAATATTAVVSLSDVMTTLATVGVSAKLFKHLARGSNVGEVPDEVKPEALSLW